LSMVDTITHSITQAGQADRTDTMEMIWSPVMLRMILSMERAATIHWKVGSVQISFSVAQGQIP
ncbi:MAG: hypothetical protein ACK5PT_00015, partial [Cereibacter sp.]